jgi:carbamoyl-phosphate synthase small subunit
MSNVFAPSLPPAALVLADGTVFHGHSFGAPGLAVGEVVFNTAMTGYQEILTDPSYCRQIVTLTYPQIGNCGVNAEDMESDRIQAEALVVKAIPAAVSNWRSERSLNEFLAQGGKQGIAGIDTRKLTRLLREKGAQNGCVTAADSVGATLDIEAALAAARGFPGLAGRREPGGSAAAIAARTTSRPRARRVAPTGWWPSTTASSGTSCGCWRIVAAS